MAWRITFFGDEIEEIVEFDPLTGKKIASLDYREGLRQLALCHARPDAEAGDGGDPPRADRAAEGAGGRRAAARGAAARAAHQFRPRDDRRHRLVRRHRELLRFLTGRLPGEPPPTLFEYLPDNALLFVDESHQTVPQIGAMARGDHRRKLTLAEYGFRLPSCIDNRPLRFNEWDAMRPQTVARLGDARALGDGADRRRLRRAGDPPDRPDRPAGRDQAGRGPGRRPASHEARGDGAQGLSHARHHADQAHGRGSHRIPARGRASGSATCIRTSRRWSGSS